MEEVVPLTSGSPEAFAWEVLARAYGLRGVTLAPFQHGSINWVARVGVPSASEAPGPPGGAETGSVWAGSYALKRYNPAYFQREDVTRSVKAQHHCFARGVPVAAIVANRDGGQITWAPDASYVLFADIAGGHVVRGECSATAARSLGETVGRAVLALGEPWRPLREPWTVRSAEDTVRRFEQLLGAAERGSTALDRLTVDDVRRRLAYLARHPDEHAHVMAMPMQWVHGDLLDTNVLFGPDDRVRAVVDFDNTTVLPRGFDFMWALMYCIGQRGAERDEYLRGYCEVARPNRDELATYVPLWRYMAITTIWPLEERYLEPERYDPRWEPWCWESVLPESWEADMRALAEWLMGGSSECRGAPGA